MTWKLPFQSQLNWGVGEGATPFLGLLHFTHDPWLIILSAKPGGIKYHFFESLIWLDLGLNPSLTETLGNNLLIRAMARFYPYIYIYIYIYIYLFESLIWLDLGLNPSLTETLGNNLLNRAMARFYPYIYIYIYIYIVMANSLKSQNGTLFLDVWRRGRLALDPL